MYYVAGYSYYKLEYLFRTGIISAQLKPARFHLLFVFRLLINNTKLPRFNSHDMAKFCTGVMDVLWNDNEVKNRFMEAAQIIETISKGNFDRDFIRTESFTDQIKTSLGIGNTQKNQVLLEILYKEHTVATSENVDIQQGQLGLF